MHRSQLFLKHSSKPRKRLEWLGRRQVMQNLTLNCSRAVAIQRLLCVERRPHLSVLGLVAQRRCLRMLEAVSLILRIVLDVLMRESVASRLRLNRSDRMTHEFLYEVCIYTALHVSLSTLIGFSIIHCLYDALSYINNCSRHRKYMKVVMEQEKYRK